jgi:diacylglycerol kinase (ATP)
MSITSQRETLHPTTSATRPPMTARRVLLAVNPKAGRRTLHGRVQDMERAISAAGYDVQIIRELENLATASASSLASGDVRAVVAVGGDGTASAVRNCVPLEIPLVPLPAGTENLLGRYLGHTMDPDEVCRTIDHGVVIGLDMGRAGGKHFLMMLSAGFDAEVIRSLEDCRRGNITRLAYVRPMLTTASRYRYPEIQVNWGDAAANNEPIRCRWLFAFNLPLYALGLPIVAEASASDGVLDVCAFQRGSVWNVARYLWHVWRGGHRSLDDVEVVRTNRFRLESPGPTSIAYQLDGDFGGYLPVEVEVQRGAFRALVSCETAQRLGFEPSSG